MTITQHLQILHELQASDRRAMRRQRISGIILLLVFSLGYGLFYFFNHVATNPVVLQIGQIFNWLLASAFGLLCVYAVWQQRKWSGFSSGSRASSSQSKQAEVYFHRSVVPSLLQSVAKRVQPATPTDLIRGSRFLSQFKLYQTHGANTVYTPAKFSVREMQKYLVNYEDLWSLQTGLQVAYVGEVKVQKFRALTTSGYWQNLGSWLVVKTAVDQPFTGQTIVTSRALQQEGVFGPDNLRLESPEFTRLFRSHTDNQREARMVLKTNVMSALIDLEKKFGRVFVEFYQQEVLIGISSQKYIFEITPNKTYTLEEAQESLQTIRYLLSLAYQLRINRH